VLDSYGWSDALHRRFLDYAASSSVKGLVPARVTVQQRGLYVLATPAGEATARLSGRFAHEAAEGDYPVAGDWVAATLRSAEASRTAFARKSVGRGGGQVVAANVDVAFLVASLNQDLNARVSSAIWSWRGRAVPRRPSCSPRRTSVLTVKPARRS
jgi:ribosome biogenesis GTPase